MKRNSIMTIVAMLLLVNVVIIMGRFGISDINKYLEILSAITAIIGIVAIWYQLKKDKELNEAQFIFELNNNFYQNEDILRVYKICNDVYIKKSKTTGLTKKDEGLVSQYFSFFGIINTFIEKGVLKIDLIDRTFSYRYFLVANNSEIQDLFLINDADYYRGNYRLYAQWSLYRKSKGYEIILSENDLLKKNPRAFDKKVIKELGIEL